SLIAQDYPNLEYIVLDGGSTDGTLAIIKRYESHIRYWHSRPDGGAGYAYNEGLRRANGEIVAFLNADDGYEPGILRAVGEAFAADPALDLVTCEARIVEHGQPTKYFRGKDLLLGEGSAVINARFFKKSLFARCGELCLTDPAGRYMI